MRGRGEGRTKRNILVDFVLFGLVELVVDGRRLEM
jgi:hypothetical protein